MFGSICGLLPKCWAGEWKVGGSNPGRGRAFFRLFSSFPEHLYCVDIDLSVSTHVSMTQRWHVMKLKWLYQCLTNKSTPMPKNYYHKSMVNVPGVGETVVKGGQKIGQFCASNHIWCHLEYLNFLEGDKVTLIRFEFSTLKLFETIRNILGVLKVMLSPKTMDWLPDYFGMRNLEEATFAEWATIRLRRGYPHSPVESGIRVTFSTPKMFWPIPHNFRVLNSYLMSVTSPPSRKLRYSRWPPCIENGPFLYKWHAKHGVNAYVSVWKTARY